MNEIEKKLLMKYLKKYFTNDKIKLLIDKYTLTQLRKMLSEIDIEYFAVAYFPKHFDRQFGKFHFELFKEIKSILDNKGIVEGFGLPRETGKSTILSFLLPLYATLFGKSPFTLIISATESIALPFLDMIKSELDTNIDLINDFNIKRGNRWNSNEIWVKVNGIDSCIMIRGIDGSLRGIHFKQYRPTLILLDDLLKEDTATSETKREQIKTTFKSVIIPIGTKESNIVIVGTILHDNDFMADLLSGRIPGVKSVKKASVIKWSERDDLWIEWERLYNNLEDINRIETAKQFYKLNEVEMIKDTQILWDEYYTYYDMMVKKQIMGERIFFREYQNNPRNSDDYPFQNLHYWDKLPSFEDMKIVMMIDPSLGKTDKSDYSAILTLGRHKQTGQIYIIDGDIRRIKPHDLIELVSKKLEEYPVSNLGVETVQFQSLLFDDMKKYLIKNQQYLIMTPVNTRTNKEVRIMGLENSIIQGYIKFNRDNKTFNRQVMDYHGKKSSFDDGIDSLSLGVKLLGSNKQLKAGNKNIY